MLDLKNAFMLLPQQQHQCRHLVDGTGQGARLVTSLLSQSCVGKMPPFERSVGFQMMEKNHSNYPSSYTYATDPGTDVLTVDVSGSSSGYNHLSQEPNVFSPDFAPRSVDIICERGRNAARHNEWYTDHLRNNAEKYFVSNSNQKTTIVADILATCRSRGAYFVKLTNDKARWKEIGDKEAKTKIAHGIRDQLQRMGKPIKGSSQATIEQSESGDNSNTDAKRRSISQRIKSNKKNKSKKDNNIDSKKRSSYRLLKSHPIPLGGIDPAVSIDRRVIPNSFFNRHEMSSRRLSKNSQSEVTTAHSDDLSCRIDHQTGGLTMHSGAGIHALAIGDNWANRSSLHDMSDDRMPMRLDVHSSSARSFPARDQLPDQLMQQSPLPHTMVTNPNNTLDNSNVAYLPMLNGMQVGSRSATIPYHNPNSPTCIAPAIDNHHVPTQQAGQYFPITMNSLPFHDATVAEANDSILSTFTKNNQPSKLFGMQLTATAHSTYATPPLPIDKDRFSQGECDCNEGFVLSSSPTFGPEHEKDNDVDDDISLSLSFIWNDDYPELL
jgi:hypothetical protein